MNAKDALTEALVACEHDLTIDGKLGLGHEDCREDIAVLADWLVKDLAKRGYVIRRPPKKA